MRKKYNRPPKGDRSEEFDFSPKNPIFEILANNLKVGLSEIAEGTFLEFLIFRQHFEFSIFSARLPPGEVKIDVF